MNENKLLEAELLKQANIDDTWSEADIAKKKSEIKAVAELITNMLKEDREKGLNGSQIATKYLYLTELLDTIKKDLGEEGYELFRKKLKMRRLMREKMKGAGN